MGNVNVGHLYKKRTVRKMDGSIFLMTDEANGGTLIQGGRVVNQERIDELAKIEQDKRSSATEATQASVPQHIVNQRLGIKDNTPEPIPVAPEPTKIEVLEKEVAGIKDNISQILELLQKK